MDNVTKEKTSSNIYRPDVEAFTKLWSSLRTFFEGTNVTKTIARLLHSYQPEDGIEVYSKLLRTLYVMLKNFDAKGFCTLASMVPPPKGASATDVVKTFYDATGHYRLNVPVLRFNKNACRNQVNSQLKRAKLNAATSIQLKIPVEIKPDSVLNLKKYSNETNLPLKKRKVVVFEECRPIKDEDSNLKPLSSEEILPNNQTDAILKETLQPETELQKPILKDPQGQIETMDETNLKEQGNDSSEIKPTEDLKIAEEANENSPIKNQETDKELVKFAASCKSGSKRRLELEPASATIGLKKRDKIDEESKKFFHESVFKEMTEDERKLQRAIRRDIRKMDYVMSDCEEYELPDDAHVTFEIQDNLKHSLKKFLNQVQNGTTLPEKEYLERPKDEAKKYTKSINPYASTKRSTDYDSEMKKVKTQASSQPKYLDVSLGKSIKRKKPEPPTRPRSERVAQRNLQNTSADSKADSGSISKRTRSVKKKVYEEQNINSEFANFEPEMSSNLLPIPAMKTPAYKKQCYDTMMNIQTAKIAVADSLAISSVASYPAYPYYVNYFNHQRHMMHQPQFMMDPYCQNNWRYQAYGHYRQPQPAHSMHYGMNLSNQKYSMISGGYFQAMNSEVYSDHKHPAIKQENYPAVCPSQENVETKYNPMN